MFKLVNNIKDKTIKTTVNFFGIVTNHLVFYPTPINLNYLWNFGSLAGIAFGIQLVSGLLLSMHYHSSILLAFISVEHIMRDVSYGWLIRYIHANGSSIFFFLVYIHIARGLFFSVFSRSILKYSLWVSGLIIYILMMAIAFLGYVLPWGQMSFWAATVITNLFTVIPYFGLKIVYWLWGGFSVGAPTLVRFFILHYLLPFVLAVLVILHLALLHIEGSLNPMVGASKYSNFIFFHPYFWVKDFFGFFIIFICYFFLVSFIPNALSHPVNYILADPLVTPPHIVPEWYFLPFYAILRAIPSKIFGVIGFGGSIVILFIIPFLWYIKYPVKIYGSLYKSLYFIFIFIFLGLGWLGSQPAMGYYIPMSLLLTILYFLVPLVIIPLSIFFLTFGLDLFSYHLRIKDKITNELQKLIIKSEIFLNGVYQI